MNEAEMRARREEIHNQREGMIAKISWMVQGVGAGDGQPPFAYTIGLHGKGLPELIVIGLHDQRAMMLLNEVAARLIDAPTLRGKFESENWSMPFYLLDADKAICEGGYTYGAASRSDGQANYIQVVLPDRSGKFPWEEGCDEGFKQALPLVSTPPQ